MSNSEKFSEFIQSLRETGTHLNGTDKQIAMLISDALGVIDPDTEAASEDAETLNADFSVIGEYLEPHGLDGTEYPDDEEED